MESIVTFPLLFASLISTVLIFERLWFWTQIRRKQPSLIRVVFDSYRQDHQKALLKLKQNTDLPIARIFLAALTLEEATPEEFDIALESAVYGELPLLQRFNTTLNTIVGIAPLLGLLGTILGLIRALSTFEFGSIGSDTASNVTAGIDEALLSTAAGLIVAIFTLAFANLFQGFYRQQKAFIQETVGQLELMYRQWYRQSYKGDGSWSDDYRRYQSKRHP